MTTELQTPPNETPEDRMVRLATRLLELGVSMQVTKELLSYDLDIVEQQLEWLPARRVRKPASLIVTAIRERYDAPSGLFHEAQEDALRGKTCNHPESYT